MYRLKLTHFMVLTKGMSMKRFKNKKIKCMFPIFNKWVSLIFFANEYICIIYMWYIYIYIYTYIYYIIYKYVFMSFFFAAVSSFRFFYLAKPSIFIIAIIITIIFINVTVRSVVEKSCGGGFQESNSSCMVYPYSSR